MYLFYNHFASEWYTFKVPDSRLLQRNELKSAYCCVVRMRTFGHRFKLFTVSMEFPSVTFDLEKCSCTLLTAANHVHNDKVDYILRP